MGGLGGSPTVKTPLGGGTNNTVTYHGVCLTVWSHADAERTTAIRRTLEASRARKESANSLVSKRAKSSHSVKSMDPTHQARRKTRSKGPWNNGTDADTDFDGGETDADLDGGISESDYEAASTTHGPGESTLFLPGDTVFWLPYALSKSLIEAVVKTQADLHFHSSGVSLPDLRLDAGLLDFVMGSLLEGCAITHTADQQDFVPPCASSWRARPPRCIVGVEQHIFRNQSRSCVALPRRS